MSENSTDAAIVGLFASAAALAAVGTSGAAHLMDRARRKQARQRDRENRDAAAEALRAEIDLEELKKRARAQGVDESRIEQACQPLSVTDDTPSTASVIAHSVGRLQS